MPVYVWEVNGFYESWFVTIVAESLKEELRIAKKEATTFHRVLLQPADRSMRVGDGEPEITVYDRLKDQMPLILKDGDLAVGYYGE